MTQAFKLARIEGREIVPDTGESLGEILAAHAADLEQSRRNTDSDPQYWASKVAQLYYLAADAYEHGAAVSFGHNRSDRYTGCATRLRKHAGKLEDEGKAARDEAESKRLLTACREGMQHGTGTRFSFDDRKAFQLGQWLKQEGRELPKRLNVRREDRSEWLEDDLGQRFTVDYPEGKVNMPVVTKLD